mmetsp:Transcript_79056/g.228563  ORF Transcript_79056/g.228563 Transcript_79056/m.228563 type:complete len:217 (-) Transcript_79056:199-849(-)
MGARTKSAIQRRRPTLHRLGGGEEQGLSAGLKPPLPAGETVLQGAPKGYGRAHLREGHALRAPEAQAVDLCAPSVEGHVASVVAPDGPGGDGCGLLLELRVLRDLSGVWRNCFPSKVLEANIFSGGEKAKLSLVVVLRLLIRLHRIVIITMFLLFLHLRLLLLWEAIGLAAFDPAISTSLGAEGLSDISWNVHGPFVHAAAVLVLLEAWLVNAIGP